MKDRNSTTPRKLTEKMDFKIKEKSDFLKSVFIPKNDRDCWVWLMNDLQAARRQAFRIWHGDDKDLEINAEGDCHFLCVNWSHLHLKPEVGKDMTISGNPGTPAFTGNPGVYEDGE